MTLTIDPAQNPKVERGVRKFLEALNSGDGKPLETLSPAEARAVLVNAQPRHLLDLKIHATTNHPIKEIRK